MNKKKSLNNLEQKIINSKFDIVRKSLYFIIAPIIILLVGVILLSTVGFSKGIDFSGGQTFKVYVNDEAKLADVATYNLDKKEDYDAIYKKINIVLNENNVKLVSYQTTKVDLKDYDVYSGQAVQITYQTNSKSSEKSEIREDLINAFDYASFDGAISSIDEVPAIDSIYDWTIGIFAGVMFGLVAAIIYMAFRYSKSSIFVVFIQTILDIFLTLGLLLVLRVPVNLTVGAVILSTFVISLINSFVFYNRIKTNKNSGLYEGVTNIEMANKTTKQIAYKKTIMYIAVAIASIIFIIFSVNAVKMFALAILLSLFATYYTSTFILPSFWSVAYKGEKVKKKQS